MDKEKRDRLVSQEIYFYLALAMLVFAIVSFGVAAGVGTGVIPKTAIPVKYVEFIRFLYFYQIAHFFIGVVLFILLALKRRRGEHNARMVKTLIGMVFTPINFLLLLADMIVLGANLMN